MNVQQSTTNAQNTSRTVYDHEGFAFEFRDDACNFVNPDSANERIPTNALNPAHHTASKIEQLIAPIITVNCFCY